MPTGAVTGAVAKKIALFEFPVEDSSSCRLKRKHAIKRRKNQKRDASCRDSPTSEEGSEQSIAAFSVAYSTRSESDLCSSYGYGTGTELNSMSSISRQSSPSIADSDPPPDNNNARGVIDDGDVGEGSNSSNNVHHVNQMSKSNLFSSSSSNYDANSSCTVTNCHDSNGVKHARRDGVKSESSAIDGDHDDNDDGDVDVAPPDLTGSTFSEKEQETVADVVKPIESLASPTENYYSDDVFLSQNQINLKFPAAAAATTSSAKAKEEGEEADVVVEFENRSESRSSGSSNSLSKKFKFQSSIHALTNSAKKKCLSKKLFFFGHNFLPQNDHHLRAPSPDMKAKNCLLDDASSSSRCRSKSLSEIESTSSISSPPEILYHNNNKTATKTNGKKVKSKNQLRHILNTIKSMEKEIFVVSPPTNANEQDSEPFYEEVDELRRSSSNNNEKMSEISTEGILGAAATTTTTAGDQPEEFLATLVKTTTTTAIAAATTTTATATTKTTTATTTMSTMSTSRSKDKDKIDTWNNQRRHSADCPTTLSTSLLALPSGSRSSNSSSRLRKKGRMAVGVVVVDIKDEDSPLTQRLGSCPPTPPPYESLYSEPIYGQSSSSIKSSINGTVPGGSSSNGPLWSPSSSSTACTDTENYNASVSSFGQNSSIYSANSYGQSPLRHNYPTGGSINYGQKTLPPPPPSSSSSSNPLGKLVSSASPNELPNKFSSIAKTAGRKLAKKLLSIRRASRTSSFDVESHHHHQHHGSNNNVNNVGLGAEGRRVSSPAKIQSTTTMITPPNRDNYNQIYTYSSSGSFSGSSSTSGRSSSENPCGVRRSISRPNIPPPEPPPLPISPIISKQIPPTLPPPNPTSKRGHYPPQHQQASGRLGGSMPLLDECGFGSLKKDGRDYNGRATAAAGTGDEDKPLYSNVTPLKSSSSATVTVNKTQTDSNNYLSNHTNSTTTMMTPVSHNHKSRTDINFHSHNNNEDFDDYTDSDFYDSDSELIRNFVSAVQPIYSMEEEPLYQYYTYGISLKPEDDYQPVIPKNLGLTLDMLVPRVGQRTLWCELPEVMTSGILGILSDKQKQLQEAIFEILTSEVSYLKSLDVLISLFYESHELTAVLSSEELKFICGNITQVRECSQSFLRELLGKWEESWYISDIGEIVNEYALSRFTVYIDYCRNKPHQDRTLQRLRLTNDEFVNVVKSIEENPKCQMLRMDSFLMLPMQRITRLPLLVNAVIQRTQSLKEKGHCEEALKNLTTLVLDCNEAARESQDAEETAAIVEKIEFPRGMKSLSSQSLGQFILKGDFMKNPFDQHGGRSGGGQINWTFRKTKRTFYWLILFSNQLIVARKKSSGKFEAVDVTPTADSNIKPLPNIDGISKDFQHYFMLHFNRKEAVYFLGARTASEVERWRKKLEGLKVKDLQVEAIFPYDAQREDELSFDVGDLIQVSQMQADGWYFGTKIKTSNEGSNSGDAGWFPGNYTAQNVVVPS